MKKQGFAYKHPRLIYLLYILTFTFILDLIMAQVFWAKLATHEKYYAVNTRCKNPYYHHALRANVNTFAMMNGVKYKLYTNSLGFKDASCRDISKESGNKRIIFIGDSFTEGISLPYEKTFVGIIDKVLKTRNTEVLNAGVMSYSPKLYYFKIKHIIEVEKIKFNQLAVFIDMSDIHDEIIYKEFIPGSDMAENKLEHYVKEYSIRHSVIFNLVSRLINRVIPYKYDNSELAAIKFQMQYETLDNYLYNLSGWYADENYQKWGRDGFKLASYYMSELISLCKNNGIEVIIAVYPWPRQVDERNPENNHVLLWKEFADKNRIKFINLYPIFMSSTPEKVIDQYYLRNDFHFNEAGNSLIASEFIRWYELLGHL
jgi:hypothetical protein